MELPDEGQALRSSEVPNEEEALLERGFQMSIMALRWRIQMSDGLSGHEVISK
jgi:hypothetical protein